MRGFTLLEIITVILIVGVLATLAVTHYTPARDRAIGREAVAALRLIAAAERIYRMELGGYYPPLGASPETNVALINRDLRLLINENNWDYYIDSNGDNTFTAHADRTGCQYTIDQAGNEVTGAGCP